MAFHYWEKPVDHERMAALRLLLSRLKAVARQKQAIPIVVYIPTATQVYSDLHSAESNPAFLEKLKKTPHNPSLSAIAGIARELDLELVNLLPDFKARAMQGSLLYSPFDTHWNLEGRRTAASVIGSHLGRRNLEDDRKLAAN
jgi:hypothetical protein